MNNQPEYTHNYSHVVVLVDLKQLMIFLLATIMQGWSLWMWRGPLHSSTTLTFLTSPSFLGWWSTLGKPRATPRPVRNMELNNWWVQTFHCIELLNCINWSSVFQIMAYWILRNKSSEFQFMSQSNVGSGESKLHERSFRIAQQNRLFSLFGSTTSGSWKRTAIVSP